MNGDAAANFRAAMRHHAASVAALTVTSAGRIYGVTLSSLTSLSLDPPMVLFALRRDSSMLARLGLAPFGLTILAERQGHIAEFLARRGRPPVPDVWLDFGADTGNVPTIAGGAVRMIGTRDRAYPTGDHVCVIANVVAGEASGLPPLLHYLGSYASPVSLATPSRGVEAHARAW